MTPNFLIKTTEEYWLANRESVESFHKDLLQDAIVQQYTLNSFSYKENYIKEGKEVVDSYFIVKVTKVFDDAKEPEGMPMETVNYVRRDSTLE